MKPSWGKRFSDKKCFYPAYHVQIDWNGDMFICPHDWQRRNPMGNVMQIFLKFGMEKSTTNWKCYLMVKELLPCSKCKCNGTIHGSKHQKAWLDLWKKKKINFTNFNFSMIV